MIVPPNTPVVSFTPGSKYDLKPGAQMIVFAGQKQPDGSVEFHCVVQIALDCSGCWSPAMERRTPNQNTSAAMP